MGSASEMFTSVLPALMLVIGGPIAVWWWTKRTRSGSTHRLRITDKAALGRNTWVAILEVDDKRFLVGAGESGVALVSDLDPLPAPPAADAAATGSALESPRTGHDERPGMGLYRRLQQMTLRTASRHPERPFHASNR